MSAHSVPPLDLTIGAVLTGFTVTLFLYGIISGQAVVFFGKRGGSRPGCGTRCLVVALWCFNTLHIVLTSYAMFHYTILPRGNPSALLRLVWVYGVIFIVIECPIILVRLGYIYRIWRLTKTRIVTLLFASLAVLSVYIAGMGFYFGIKEAMEKAAAEVMRYRWMLYVVLSLQIIVDGSIAVAMFVLLQRYNTGIRSLDIVMKTITVYIVNTGVLTVILALVGIILFTFLPQSFTFIAIYWCLAQLHSCSFLAVLNAQKELIEQTAIHSHGRRAEDRMELTSALEVEDTDTGAVFTNTFELSGFAPCSSGSDSRLEDASGSGESQKPCDPGKMSISLG